MCPCHANENGEYLQKLINSASEKSLHGHYYWTTLLHYKPAGSEKESLIDDPDFFLAPNGKQNPEAELRATLHGLFTTVDSSEKHPRCRFPARYAWLKEVLSIDEDQLPRIDCSELDETLREISPRSAVLIFPAANNTRLSSIFGHTLIRIDRADQSDLLSHAVNYAALTTEAGGFVYAYKGIFGHYKGYYSMLPYYQKIKEYNDLGDRDIWEYHLNLSEKEVYRMVLHIKELKEIYSDYYFLDENCSFSLLFLLDAARPSLRLVEKFWNRPSFWVIPTDTVAAIRQAGLVSKVSYRPCLATTIRNTAAPMEKAMRDKAMAIVRQELPPEHVATMNVSQEDRKSIIDLATRCIQYQYSRMVLDQKEYKRRILAVLRAKNDIGKTSAEFDKIPVLPPPDEGHGPGKIGVGFGHREDSYFTEIKLRPVYHDLHDPDVGYLEGSQVILFEMNGRYYEKGGSFKLQNVQLIDIVLLAPRDFFFTPVSWKVNIGLDREIMPDGSEHLLYRINMGGGLSYNIRKVGIFYGMLETDLNATNRFEDNFALGAGLTIGILHNLNEWWKVSLQGQAVYYMLGESHEKYRGTLAQNFRVTRNTGIGFQVNLESSFGFYRAEASVHMNYYF